MHAFVVFECLLIGCLFVCLFVISDATAIDSRSMSVLRRKHTDALRLAIFRSKVVTAKDLSDSRVFGREGVSCGDCIINYFLDTCDK